MWVTEFCKKFYFTRYPKELYVTGLELCGTKIANISPFTRNLYILTGMLTGLLFMVIDN